MWREAPAASDDGPTRNLLSDLGLVGLAQTRPDTVKAARAVRGVDGRNLRHGRAEDALAVIAASEGAEPAAAASMSSPEGPGDLRSAVGQGTTGVKQSPRGPAFDASIVATRTAYPIPPAPGAGARP